MTLFSRLRFVLVETSHPGNIGSAARAIKTMGFSDLVLVRPRFEDALTHPDAVAFASGAGDILAQARIVDNVDDALRGCNFAAAVSARLREYSPPVMAPRTLCTELASQSALTPAFIFGNERYGLPNEVVQACNALINIPANPDYSSLNLAQAIQVLAYEARMASVEHLASDQSPGTVIGFQGDAAAIDQIEGMYQHLEQALVSIEFLDPDNPRKLMSRLRRLFSRTGLEVEEVNILRGIARQIIGGKTRRKPGQQ